MRDAELGEKHALDNEDRVLRGKKRERDDHVVGDAVSSDGALVGRPQSSSVDQPCPRTD